ncbi:MAG: DivIVA domain-containing protein [Acidobacteria bacterium]|nr:DivIVA domain-containing protein [Acidobacteriota bacterium]
MADDPAFDADEVAQKHFGTAFRGFDQYEVRAYLASLGAHVRLLSERESALRDQLAELEAHARPVGPATEAELETALGVETTRVLHAAREAAAEIRAHAEENVARLLREAQAEAAGMRAEAEAVLRQRTEEAEAAAASIVEAAQQRGREMLGEAQTLRDRMLKDLSRRRRQAEAHLEALAVGRAEVLSALESAVTAATQATTVLADVQVDTASAEDTLASSESDPPLEPADTPSLDAALASAADDELEPVAQESDEPASAEPTEAPGPDEPSPPVTRGPDERRSSSLRLLRRRPEPFQQDLDNDVDIDEGVRIIRPERPVLAAVPPQQSAELPVAPAAEPGPGPEPADELSTSTAAGADEHEDASQPVDDLFARLRADRAAAVADAEEVLAREEEPPPAPVTDARLEAPAEVAVDGLFEQRDAALDDTERALVRSLKRALSDEQNEVLDALRRLRGRPAVDALVPDTAVHQARYAAVATDALAAAATAGAAVHGGDPVAVRALADALGDEIATDLRNRVSRAIESGRDDDEALVEAISAGYREWKSARAEPFAHHHVAAAYAYGSYEAAPDGLLVWLVDPAEGGCPDCDDNALAGATAKGEAYPTGQHHPPAHAGCRCLLVPATQ